MSEQLLAVLKDFVEGRVSLADWQAWWREHSSEVEAECDRFTFLSLKHRGFVGAMSVLGRSGISFRAVTGFCRHCGSPLFTAMPGKTSKQEIRAFAESSRLPGWESIVRDEWIHPGQYCPSGCTTILWNLVRDKPEQT